MPSTIRLHRVFKAPPERVYRAFTDPAAFAKWIPPYGFVCKVHQFEPKLGGTHKMSFMNMTSGKSHSFGGKYLELVPNEATPAMATAGPIRSDGGALRSPCATWARVSRTVRGVRINVLPIATT